MPPHDRILDGPGRNARGGVRRMTKALAIDCEMVGSGRRSLLARVSIVNELGATKYDSFVHPGNSRVTDYRYRITGIGPEDLEDAPSYQEVRDDVIDMLEDHVIVGHDLQHDLRALRLNYSDCHLRDSATFPRLQDGIYMRGSKPSLKQLADHWLGRVIHTGAHNSVVDARVAMALYKMFEDHWSCPCTEDYWSCPCTEHLDAMYAY